MPHARRRNELQDAVDHAEAGAQDRDDGDLLAGDAFACGGLKRGLDLDILEREVAHSLVSLEDGELAHKGAELVRASGLVAKDVELVLDQRVVDDGQPRAVEFYGHMPSLITNASAAHRSGIEHRRSAPDVARPLRKPRFLGLDPLERGVVLAHHLLDALGVPAALELGG